jgi:tetratricopeptide (TPR) repeat protein
LTINQLRTWQGLLVKNIKHSNKNQLRTMHHYARRSIGASILGFAFVGCAGGSLYRFQSQPSEASVYYLNGNEKTVIGVTPIDYTKAALPTDTPFIIIFEKPGFETKEVSVSPTDNSQTTISTTLKASKDLNSDLATKKTRELLNKVFEVQELTARLKFVDALAVLNKLEESNPSIPEISSMRGSIYLLLNDKEQARQSWEKALKMDPSLEELRVRLKALGSDKKKGENE